MVTNKVRDHTAGHVIFAADSATSVASNNEYTITVRSPLVRKGSM